MHLNDPESTSTLSRALQVQSCELIGQFLVMLRNLTSKFCHVLKSECGSGVVGKSTAGSTNKASHGHGPNSPNTAKKVSTQNCILMLCRLAWLLQSPAGAFLNDALQVSPSSMKLTSVGAGSSGINGGSMVSHRSLVNGTAQYMTTAEQLQSAFDIADTDGDGLVTFDEAVEVGKQMCIVMILVFATVLKIVSICDSTEHDHMC
jgi:hypothetical protein